MIVDDERLNINILNNALKADYQIKVAMNGIQALDRATTHPRPDIILLDIIMPGMDGFEVIEKILRHLNLWDGGRYDLFGRGGARGPPDGKDCLEALFDEAESFGEKVKIRGENIRQAIKESSDQGMDMETETRVDTTFFDDLPPEER